MKTSHIIVGLIVAAALLMGIYYYMKASKAPVPEIPPLAEEPAATTTPPAAAWLAASSSGYAFEYPPDIGLTYVHVTDWPPALQLLGEPFACTEAGEETARAGQTTLISVNGREYCRTVVSEGAAGSVYRQYAYAFAEGDGTIILTFTTRQPQCENYDSPNREACQAEVAAFDSDRLLDSVARTMVRAE